MSILSCSQAYFYSIVVSNRSSRWSGVGAAGCENSISAWWAKWEDIH